MKNTQIGKINNQKKAVALFLAGLFLFMLLLNCLTPYTTDDYGYFFSFTKYSKPFIRIRNLWDIFESLKAHYFVANGRLVAHFFVHGFLLLPKFLFNLVNAGMFVFSMVQIYQLSWKKKHNLFLMMVIFGMVWVYEPAFGQVNLWLDGSCNYLWSIVFGLLFLKMYLDDWKGEKDSWDWKKMTGSVILSFLLGAYSENLSFAVIAGAFLILLLEKFWKKKKWKGILLVDWVVSFGGYCFMIFAPGTLKNKMGDLSVKVLLENFSNTTQEYYEDYKTLLFAFVILLVLAVYKKVEAERIVTAFVFLLISLGASYIFITAGYFPERSKCASAMMLIIAVMTLAFEVWETEHQIWAAVIGSLILLATVHWLVVGTYDIGQAYLQADNREEQLIAAKEKGEKEVSVKRITTTTKYPAAHGLVDVAVDENMANYNYSMEEYWGFDKITGYE